ncbi:MAG: response regulator [Actinomycetota bacterium]
MTRGISILHVDDDDVEREALARSLRRARSAVTHAEAVDGLRALEHLRSGGRPDLVLLDWKMPRMDGDGFLAELRADPDLADLPVIVVSTSDDRGDVRQAYSRQAAAYVVKRDAGENFERLVALIDEWAEVVSAPPA